MLSGASLEGPSLGGGQDAVLAVVSHTSATSLYGVGELRADVHEDLSVVSTGGRESFEPEEDIFRYLPVLE